MVRPRIEPWGNCHRTVTAWEQNNKENLPTVRKVNQSKSERSFCHLGTRTHTVSPRACNSENPVNSDAKLSSQLGRTNNLLLLGSCIRRWELITLQPNPKARKRKRRDAELQWLIFFSSVYVTTWLRWYSSSTYPAGAAIIHYVTPSLAVRRNETEPPLALHPFT